MRQTDPISRLHTYENLEAEIRRTKKRIQATEEDLHDRWKRLPLETIKATAGAVVPVFLSNGVATVTWKLLKQGIGLLTHKKSKEPEGKGSIGSSKKPGIFTVLKLLYGVIKK